jgi:hypothetical protein
VQEPAAACPPGHFVRIPPCVELGERHRERLHPSISHGLCPTVFASGGGRGERLAGDKDRIKVFFFTKPHVIFVS